MLIIKKNICGFRLLPFFSDLLCVLEEKKKKNMFMVNNFFFALQNYFWREKFFFLQKKILLFTKVFFPQFFVKYVQLSVLLLPVRSSVSVLPF